MRSFHADCAAVYFPSHASPRSSLAPHAIMLLVRVPKWVWLRGPLPGLPTELALFCLWAFAGNISWTSNSLPTLLIEIPGYQRVCSLSKPFLTPTPQTQRPLLGSSGIHCSHYALGIHHGPAVQQQILTEPLLRPSFHLCSFQPCGGTWTGRMEGADRVLLGAGGWQPAEAALRQ